MGLEETTNNSKARVVTNIKDSLLGLEKEILQNPLNTSSSQNVIEV